MQLERPAVAIANELLAEFSEPLTTREELDGPFGRDFVAIPGVDHPVLSGITTRIFEDGAVESFSFLDEKTIVISLKGARVSVEVIMAMLSDALEEWRRSEPLPTGTP